MSELQKQLVKFYDYYQPKKLVRERSPLNAGPKMSKERVLDKPDYANSDFARKILGAYYKRQK